MGSLEVVTNLGLSRSWTLGRLITCAVTMFMNPVFLMQNHYQTENEVISLSNEIVIYQPGHNKIMGMFGAPLYHLFGW